MTSIDPTGRLLAHLREQAQEWRRLNPPGAGKPDDAQQRTPAGERDALGLATQQVRSIDKNDPDSPRKAFRIYLASVLVKELGDGVINDPGFLGLVDRVQDTMESDLQLRESIRQAGEVLIRIAHAGKHG